jgi:hypothetical protein
MNSTFNETGRQELLAMDRFFLANQEAFREAWRKLFAAVSCAPEDLNGPLTLYEYACLSGEWRERSVMETVPPSERIPLLICYRHLSAGTPLYFDGALAVLWAIWDKLGGELIRECQSCGYRYPGGLPVPIPCCSLCRGALGDVGCWPGKVVAAWLN